MSNIVIGFNNHQADILHSFFEKCADSVNTLCEQYNFTTSSFCPPDFTEKNIISNMSNSSGCFLAAHGDRDGIYNEQNQDVVTTKTNNYNFSGKILYTVSCYSALNLKDELFRKGIKAFVGYDDKFIVGNVDAEDVFVECAVQGFKSLINGKNIKEARKDMIDKFDVEIKRYSDDNTNKYSEFIAAWLLDDEEHLCFAGDDTFTLK